MSTADGLARRLEALRAEGVDRFDPPAAQMIARLLQRRTELSPGACAQLEARAHERLDALAARFATARSLAERELERLIDLGHDPRGELARALSAGDLRRILGAARRHPERTPRSRDRGSAALRERLEDAAEARGLTSPGSVRSPEADAPAPTELAALLYRDAAAKATARITLSRALEEVPEEAGRYHAGSVAARAVALMAEKYPTYLHAQLARLEALAALDAFGQPTPPSESDQEGLEEEIALEP